MIVKNTIGCFDVMYARISCDLLSCWCSGVVVTMLCCGAVAVELVPRPKVLLLD